jgi:hypothetical protein
VGSHGPRLQTLAAKRTAWEIERALSAFEAAGLLRRDDTHQAERGDLDPRGRRRRLIVIPPASRTSAAGPPVSGARPYQSPSPDLLASAMSAPLGVPPFDSNGTTCAR